MQLKDVFYYTVILDEAVLKKNRALTEDFTKLYLELEREGFFRPSYIHNFLRLFDIFALWYAGYLFLQVPNIFAKFVGFALMGLSKGRNGWVGHECGHYSFSGMPKIDRAIQIFFFSKFVHLSIDLHLNDIFVKIYLVVFLHRGGEMVIIVTMRCQTVCIVTSIWRHFH